MQEAWGTLACGIKLIPQSISQGAFYLHKLVSPVCLRENGKQIPGEPLEENRPLS